MRTQKFIHLAAATALGASMSCAFAASAMAASDNLISINPGNVPATAANYTHECSENLGGGPYPGKDVWVFNLPSKGSTFTAVNAAFDTNGDGKADTTVVIDAGAGDGDDIVLLGTSKAYAITDAGWTLIGATATVTGDADKFVLTHTCPTTPTTPPTTAPTTAPTQTSTTPTESATPTQPGTTPDESTAPGGGTGDETGGAASGGLALTGADAGGAALLGLGLIGGGAALMLRRRRRFTA